MKSKKSISNLKRTAAVVLAVIMLMSCAMITSFASDGYSQTHVVPDHQTAYAKYKNIFGVAAPMDGTNGNPDLCIPGLSAEDNMVPQGMTYWAAKNWVLISSAKYNNTAKAPSVVFALDLATGKLVAQFDLYNADGSANTAHAGGIACSENNLYYADEGSAISYIPLSELDVAEGTVKNITLAGTVDLSAELGGCNTSYASFGDGVLWTGNFYIKNNDTYGTEANPDSATIIVGYKLSGYASSTDEWAAFTSMAGAPGYVIPLSSYGIDKVQCAVISGGKAYVGTSWGRRNDSTLYVFDIDLSAEGTVPMTVNGNAVNAYALANKKTFTYIPMTEGMFVKDNGLYCLFESAAYQYYGDGKNGGDGGNSSKDPSDVVWRFDTETLANTKTKDNFIRRIIKLIKEFINNIITYISKLFK